MTLAVASILIVTGLRPHENRMMPPERTAASTAADVQLAAVPSPITRVGCELSRGRPPAGTATACTPTGELATELAGGSSHAEAGSALRAPIKAATRLLIPQA